MGRLLDEQMVLARLHKYFANGFDEDRWWNSTHVLMAINETPSVERKGQAFRCSECNHRNECCAEYCPKCSVDMRGNNDG